MARPSRPSSSKKVSRVASTGGGRSARSTKPLVWWGVMGLVVLLGIAGVVMSRQDRQERGPAALTPPTTQDHWHAAYGVYLCDELAAPIQNQNDPKGIHTHADGIIHVHPFSSAAGGDNAILEEFTKAAGLTLSDSKVKVPGGKTFEEGKTECDGEPGIVQLKVDGEIITEDVLDLKFEDRQVITIAFAPEGAEIPDPPSVPNLDNLSDVPASEQQQAPIPGSPPGGETVEEGDGTGDGTADGSTEETGTDDGSSDSSPSTSAP